MKYFLIVTKRIISYDNNSPLDYNTYLVDRFTMFNENVNVA